MPVEVHSGEFSGPFDLLLHLILSEEMDIFEVSISDIVERFVATIDSWRSNDEPIDLESLTEFILVAATLIELKARRLLPGRSAVDLDEELMRFEERDLLLARLVDCKTFRDVADFFTRSIERAQLSVPRRMGAEEPFASLSVDPLEGLAPTLLAKAAARALTPKPVPQVSIAHLSPIRYTVKETAQRILQRVPEGETISFRALVHGVEDRIERIVFFLAILELYKQGAVEISQLERFGDLEVERLSGVFDMSNVDAAEWNEAPDELDTWDIDEELAANRAADEVSVSK